MNSTPTQNDSYTFQRGTLPLILVVDDDQTMRSLLRRAMEKEGYQVVEAKDGEECLTIYERFHPDMILLDAVMPRLDGFTCCARIRALPEGDRVPIIMITCLEDKHASGDTFLIAGVTDFMPKPINWKTLRHRVCNLLQYSISSEQEGL